jgi:hypothetical protein
MYKNRIFKELVMQPALVQYLQLEMKLTHLNGIFTHNEIHLLYKAAIPIFQLES